MSDGALKTLVQVKFGGELLGRLDDWRARARPIPTRADAIRVMVEGYMAGTEAPAESRLERAPEGA